MKPHENILIIRLKSIGDIMFTLPSVNRLRARYPEAHLSFLVSREHAPLVEGFRALDEVLTLDRARLRGHNPVAMAGEILTLFHRLRKGKYSLVVDLQGYGETGLMTWWTAARRRWGTLYRSGRSWAYTHPVRCDRTKHPVRSHLDLLTECGVPPSEVCNDFDLPAAPLAEARRIFSELGLKPDRRTLFIQPFTSTEGKSWPLEHYLTIATKLREEGRQVLFGGGAVDRVALGPAREKGFALSAGTPLLVTAGLMKLSTAVLGGDTGMLHVATAMGRRVIMLMASMKSGSCCPFQHPDWVLMAEPGTGVSGLETSMVETACERVLAEAADIQSENQSGERETRLSEAASERDQPRSDTEEEPGNKPHRTATERRLAVHCGRKHPNTAPMGKIIHAEGNQLKQRSNRGSWPRRRKRC